MEFFTKIATRVQSIRDLVGELADPSDLPAAVARLDDVAVFALLEAASDLEQTVERVRTAAIGIIAQRSARPTGHAGLAQSRGYRNAASLVQQVGGVSRAEAFRQVRVGESLYDTVGSGHPSETVLSVIEGDGVGDIPVTDAGGSGGSAGLHEQGTGERGLPWHAPLGRALLSGAITTAQHDVIARGLGQPAAAPSPTAQHAVVCDAATHAAWTLAAEELIVEAGRVTVEELARSARCVRDLLDPVGADARFMRRFESRSFRMWTDRDGLTRCSLVCDDLSAEWLRATIDAAMRPRRGGPRFVDPAERARANTLIADPRSNEQLAFDLLIDIVRSGTLADTETVFGVRQPGVRLVQILPDSGGIPGIIGENPGPEPGHEGGPDNGNNTRRRDSFAGPSCVEDGARIVPGWVAKQQACTVGTVTVTTDRSGNPLNMGRSARLYTTKQRIALAVRDGGCRWIECDRPASYCEAHHIDPWDEHHGRTDVDRGILLCRFHHMQLHRRGWRITREGTAEFVLHAADGQQTVLPRGLVRRYLWPRGTSPPARWWEPPLPLAA
ncbi:HNH endonuclease [Leucobacter coleopterorum]|uniref:HNH endonuclease n=1 Tax=Leucobacter coleopterorum TaxID=2714933 RepID=A0ABX6JZM1_9MICO|nr:HNH endonuclease signature motif containing protein [Leucobacter coleopterorum]QIM18215.1 HNH endonuclease [Leucobacter coleopterorum]